MKKNISYIILIYFITRSTFVGISFLTQSTLTGQNAWLSVLLGFIIGFIPITIIYKIAKYKPELNIIEKINYLFPKTNKIIKTILFLTYFLFAIITFWNLTNLANTQFLNKTPLFVISISFIIPIIYLLSKNNKIILRVGVILFFISVFLFLISFVGLTNKIKIYNLFPIEYNLFKGIIPYLSYNVLPIFVILLFPNDKVYKSIYKGYIFSFLFIFIATFLTISVLGNKFTMLLQYPELFILKHAFQHVLTFRLEHFLIIQWVLDMFMFISLCIKFCNDSFKIKNIFILPIIILFTNNFIFKSTMIENNLIINLFPNVFFISLSTIILLIYIKSKKVN